MPPKTPRRANSGNPDVLRASRVSVEGPALDPNAPPQVGKPTEIKIRIHDGAGVGPLGVNVDCALLPKPLEVIDHHDGTMSILFTPLTNGPHVFTITWGQEPVPGSPFTVEVIGTPQRDASLVVVDTSVLKRGGMVHRPLRFAVMAPEAAGPGPLQVDVTGVDEPRDIVVEYVSSGKFEVSLLVTTAGLYRVGVYWGEFEPSFAVPGSPFEVRFVEAGSGSPRLQPPVPSYLIVDHGADTMTSSLGSSTSSHSTEMAKSPTRSPARSPKHANVAAGRSSQGSPKPPASPSTTTSSSSGHSTTTTTSSTAPTSTPTPTPTNPSGVVGPKPGTPSKPKGKATSTVARATASSSAKVVTKSARRGSEPAPSSSSSHVITSPTTASPSATSPGAPGAERPRKGSSLIAPATLPKMGPLPGVGSTPSSSSIPSSSATSPPASNRSTTPRGKPTTPRATTPRSSTPRATTPRGKNDLPPSHRIVVSGPALAVPPVVSVSSELTIKINEGAGLGPLGVNVDCAMLPKPLNIVDHHDGTMSVVFTPLANGIHVFKITWGDEPVPGSPFRIEVIGTPKRDPSLIVVDTAPLKRGGILNRPLKFGVTAPEGAGPGPLQVDVVGPDEPQNILVEYVNTGRFEVTIEIGTAGVYQISVYWGEFEPCYAVRGSPFDVKFA